MSGPGTIATPRLVLRPLAAEDAPALHALWTAPPVREQLWDGRSIPWEQTAQLVGRSEALFDERGLGLWGARRAGAAALVGFGGFWHFRSEIDVELLYGIAPPHWGEGLGAELARALVAHGFGALRMAEIRASTGATNYASIRILRRLGFLRRPAAGAGDAAVQSWVLPRGVFHGAGFDDR